MFSVLCNNIPVSRAFVVYISQQVCYSWPFVQFYGRHHDLVDELSQRIFIFSPDFCLSSITDMTFTGNVYQSRAPGFTLSLLVTSMLLINLLCCVFVVCVFALCFVHLMLPGYYISIRSNVSITTTITRNKKKIKK